MLIDLHQLKGIYLICGKTDLRRGWIEVNI